MDAAGPTKLSTSSLHTWHAQDWESVYESSDDVHLPPLFSIPPPPKCSSDSCVHFRFIHGAHYGSISGAAAWHRVAIEQNELSGALLPFDSLSVSISNMLADQKRSHRRSASAASLASTSSVASATSDATDQ